MSNKYLKIKMKRKFLFILLLCVANAQTLSIDEAVRIALENKPSITLLRWSKGCVFDPDYLRKGVLFSNNTSINLI